MGNNLFDLLSLEEQAIEYIRSFQPPQGYILAFSGGKDSVVLRHLAIKAGARFDAVYYNTTVDPPELVRFVRSHDDVLFCNSGTNMRELVIQNGPPMRMRRFCCKYLKERSFPGRVVLSGVRWAESANRAKNHGVVTSFGRTKATVIIYNDDNDECRRMVENCMRTQKILINPIINWKDDDIWEYIKKEGIRYCHLYDEGFDRLGCIGCPMASKETRKLQFARWPKYAKYYIRAFDAFIVRRKEKGNWRHDLAQTGAEMFRFWMDGRMEREVRDELEWEGEEMRK